LVYTGADAASTLASLGLKRSLTAGIIADISNMVVTKQIKSFFFIYLSLRDLIIKAYLIMVNLSRYSLKYFKILMLNPKAAGIVKLTMPAAYFVKIRAIFPFV